MLEGGMKAIKVLLFVFNLLIVIAGIALIATGAYVNIEMDEFFDCFDSDILRPGLLIIAVGVLIFFVAFFGCCGAHKENHCLVMTFAVSLSIIFILLLSAGIAGYVLREDIKEKGVKNCLIKLMKNYGDENQKHVTDTWNNLQEKFDCCGVNDFKDWKNTPQNLSSFPKSCCKDEKNCKNSFKQSDSYIKTQINTDACPKKLEDSLMRNIAVIGGVGIGFAFVQIAGVVLSCFLAAALRKEYEAVQ